MARKVIIDVDPGIDDAVALTAALFEPQLDVLAVTPTAGTVDGRWTTRNVQVIVEQLDPPKWPRIGAALPAPPGAIRVPHLHGADGLGESDLQVAERHHRHPSDKLITDIVRSAPHQVSILTLGPLTNVASAFRRDPELPRLIERLVIAGGSVTAAGNVTPGSEFNFYCDPLAAREVLHAPVPKMLVPLDVTQHFIFTFSHFDRLPPVHTRVGRLLRQILPYSLRAHHQHLALEGAYLPGVVALCVLLQPGPVRTVSMAGDVEVMGELTRGASVFDRRPLREWETNVEVVVEISVREMQDDLLGYLSRAAER